MTDEKLQRQRDEQTTERANPQNDGGTVALDEITLDRDPETGELEPKAVDVEEIGKEGETVRALPLNKAARRKYLKPLREGEDVGDELLARMFDDHLVEPDLTEHPRCPDDGVSERFIREDLDPAAEDGLFIAILEASGERELVELLRKVNRGELTEEDLEEQQTPSEGN